MNTHTTKTARIGLAALLLGAATAPALHAQDAVPVQKPLSIKLGVFLPSDSKARDAAGSTWFAAGADYAFSKTDASAPVLPLAYFDYTGASKHGNHVNVYAVGVGFRAYATRATNQSVAAYYGAGVGVDFVNAKGGGQSKTNTQIGGKLDIGAEINSGPFIEAAYQIVPQKVEGVRAGGFNIMVGDRF